MSEESTALDPVERVRQSFETANRGELDENIRQFAADGVWDTSRSGFGVFKGAASIRRFWVDWFGAYAELQMEPEELVDVGNGVVFGIVRQKARPIGPTGHIRQREGCTWVWAEGLCTSVTVYPEAEIDAARAAGAPSTGNVTASACSSSTTAARGAK